MVKYICAAILIKNKKLINCRGGEISQRLKLKIVIVHIKTVDSTVDVISINSVNSNEYKNQLMAKAENEVIKKGVA